MKQFIKRNFPTVFEYLLHRRRVAALRKQSALENKSIEFYKAELDKMYLANIGRPMNWDSPMAYTEKMQWDKLFNRDPRKSRLSDKLLVREWVSEMIGEEYLIPILGSWKCFDEIDFDSLPEKFVLKTNHGSGTNAIVKDKNSVSKRVLKWSFDDWMKTNYAFSTGFEMHYSDIEPMIIAEQYMESEDGELQDYKFLCFDGKPYYCWVDKGRFSVHTRNVYDLNWILQPWNQASYGISAEEIPRPKNFDIMIELAEKLSKGFPHVRVDFYNVDGKIYFGEMTFTNGSGLDPIIPDEYDYQLGFLWKQDR